MQIFQDRDLEREYQEVLAGAYGPVRHALREMQKWDMPRLQRTNEYHQQLSQGDPAYSQSQWSRQAMAIMMGLRTREQELLSIPDTPGTNLGLIPGGADPFASFAAYNKGPQQQPAAQQNMSMGPAYFGIGGLAGRQQQQQGSQTQNLWGGITGQRGGGYGAQLGPMMDQAYGRVTGHLGLGSQSGSQYTR